MRAPLPSDERDRLQALRELELMDRRPEPDLDGIVELTAGVCGTPVSLVSIIDSDRHTVRAGYGIDLTDEPRDDSLCAHTILGRGLLVVPDARADPRFADNPHVTREPGIRFYAGAPLLTGDGHALGTLCVADAVPRRLGLGQLRALRALGRQVTNLLELRHSAAVLARTATRRHETERLHVELAPLISGELRAPLVELRRGVEVLRDLEFCPAGVAAGIGAAVHAHAPDLLRLLDNLLRIGDPAEGGPGLARREVDLNALIDWAVREVRPIAEARDIHLRLDAGPPALVSADARRLAQAMSHLMFCAVKFTPPSGRIRVRVAGGSVTPTAELHVLGLRDDPATLFPHLVNGTLRTATDTPGLAVDEGLAALKSILDAHHATLALCDGPEEGTAFHVVFPPAVA
jgi:signal transduction histidine kinase